MAYKIPTLGLPEGINTSRSVIAGVLICLFSLEHIIALCSGEEVSRHGTDDPVRAVFGSA